MLLSPESLTGIGLGKEKRLRFGSVYKDIVHHDADGAVTGSNVTKTIRKPEAQVGAWLESPRPVP